MTRADRRCTTPGRLARETGGRAPVILAEMLQETLVDGVRQDHEEVIHGSHHGPSLRAEKCSFQSPCLRGERGHWQPAVTVRLAPFQSFDEGVVLGT
jgi:hypothetical protein